LLANAIIAGTNLILEHVRFERYIADATCHSAERGRGEWEERGWGGVTVEWEVDTEARDVYTDVLSETYATFYVNAVCHVVTDLPLRGIS